LPLGEASFVKIIGLKYFIHRLMIKFYFIFFTTSTKTIKKYQIFLIYFFTAYDSSFYKKNNQITENKMPDIFYIPQTSDESLICSWFPDYHKNECYA